MSTTANNGTIEKIHTGIAGTEETDTINITSNAIEVINKVKAENQLGGDYFLRLGTRSGGCAGMTYALGFDTDLTGEDRVFELRDLKIAIDNKSLFYFLGVTLDYIDGPQGSGFIFTNPNNYHTCGCQN